MLTQPLPLRQHQASCAAQVRIWNIAKPTSHARPCSMTDRIAWGFTATLHCLRLMWLLGCNESARAATATKHIASAAAAVAGTRCFKQQLLELPVELLLAEEQGAPATCFASTTASKSGRHVTKRLQCIRQGTHEQRWGDVDGGA